MKVEVKNQEVKYISDCSLECDENTLFLKTKQNENFASDAQEKGARIVSAKECFEILNIKNIKIIGITGTNGKTTTAAAIYSILLDLGYKCALQGTRGFFVNNKQIEQKSLTTPPILQILKNLSVASQENCEFFIMEVSSHAIIQNRIDSLKFALKIFTNISQDHLDFHKDMQSYINAKSSFFQDDSPKLINIDDSKILYSLTNLHTYGIEKNAEYKVIAYSLKDGINAIVKSPKKDFEFNSILQGNFNLYNLCAALGAVDILTDKSTKDICNAIECFGGVKGRMEVVNEKPLVIVDFAHTPDGIEKVLDSMKGKKLIVLFGAGGDRDRTKRPLMGEIASKYAFKIYITSDNPRSEDPISIIDDIMAGIVHKDNVIIQADRKNAILQALKSLQDDEVLMILGKGDETYQEINKKKFPFDDAKIVKEFFQIL